MTNEKPRVSKDVEIIESDYDKYKDWTQDPIGYFLIRLNNGVIEVGFCKENNVIETVIKGKTPQEIYYTAVKKKLLTRFEHAAYLGKELEKAYLALKHGLDYVQDEELKIN